MPGVAVAVDDADELGPRVAHTREVRHGREARLVVQPRDDLVGHLAGAAARTVGDRHERRREGLEVGERAQSRFSAASGVFGGKNSKLYDGPPARISVIFMS